jgi:hypothetical protein
MRLATALPFFVKDENSDLAVVGRRYSVVTDDLFAFFKK